MYKTDLVRQVARKTLRHEELIAEVLDAALVEIADTLVNGEEVLLPGFGTFFFIKRKQGEITNFKTKKREKIPAMRLVSFRPYPNLKKAVRKRNA